MRTRIFTDAHRRGLRLRHPKIMFDVGVSQAVVAVVVFLLLRPLLGITWSAVVAVAAAVAWDNGRPDGRSMPRFMRGAHDFALARLVRWWVDRPRKVRIR